MHGPAPNAPRACNWGRREDLARLHGPRGFRLRHSVEGIKARMGTVLTGDVKFGTSGLRGPADAFLAGEADSRIDGFFRHLPEREAQDRFVLIGSDRRESGQAIAARTVGLAKANGFGAHYCGLVPTPCLAHAAKIRGACAIMVTGSHIPADRNGLKFYGYSGEIDKTDEDAIAMAESGSSANRLHGNLPKAVVDRNLQVEILSKWHERYASLAGRKALAGLRVGLYVGSTVAAAPLEKLLRALGADVFSFGRNSSFVPLDTEAVDEIVLDQCWNAIIGESLDCVVSSDPDGDRPLVIDEHGEVTRGDLLGWVTARWLDADHVSTTVSANSAIGQRPLPRVMRTRIGSPHVIAAIGEALTGGARLAVGFEPNGGFLLGSDCSVDGNSLASLMTRDSFLPILATLLKLAREGEPISTFAGSWGFRAAASDRLTDADPERVQVFMSRLADLDVARGRFFGRYGAVRSLDRTDGLRAVIEPSPGKVDGPLEDALSSELLEVGGTPEWIIHLRPSGNAPEMRCYVETKTNAGAMALLAACMQHLEKELGGGLPQCGGQ